jgi:membrane-bound lytic murein transglycosylase D
LKRYAYISAITILILLILVLFFFGTRKAAEEYSRDFKDNYKIYSIPLPEKISFANEPVPLYIVDIKERLERELLMNVYYQSQTIMYLKRANRYFPLVEDLLKKNGIPDDFKYIALVESGFQNVVSSSAAVGFWQIIEPTAKQLGLEVNEEVDERYNVVKSTEAICKYFKRAYSVFNNWTMVAGSFNMGIVGILNQVRLQNVNSFYDLYLNSETSRYVFRILAFKEIFENQEKYGYYILKDQLYPPYRTYTIQVDSPIKDLVQFAFSKNASYKDLKTFNVWLRKSYLTNKSRKTYIIELPVKSTNTTVTDYDTFPVKLQYDTNVVFPKDSLVYHIVKDNENINTISKKYHVKVPQILQWNDLQGYYLKKGQKLKIYVPVQSN